MPLKEDAIEEIEPESSTGDEAAAKAAEPAESSPATDEADAGTMSIVRDAVDKTKPVAETAPSAEASESDEDADDEQPKKTDAERYSDVPFSKHPRFQQLVRENRANKTDAEAYRNIRSFMTANSLNDEDAAEALTVAALLKSDPHQAWAKLKPVVQQLLHAVGEVIPDELNSRVQAGEMSREAAIEISRARAAAQAAEQRRTFEQQQMQRMQQTAAQAAIRQAADDWEADRRLRDPMFEAKSPLLVKEIAYLHATEGKPDTPEGVRSQLRRAYKAVNESFVSAAPTAQRKPAIRPVTGGQVAGNARPAPKSTADIIDNVLAARAGG